jgi:hypothetical protein
MNIAIEPDKHIMQGQTSKFATNIDVFRDKIPQIKPKAKPRLIQLLITLAENLHFSVNGPGVIQLTM